VEYINNELLYSWCLNNITQYVLCCKETQYCKLHCMYCLACCIASVSASVTQSCKEQSAYFRVGSVRGLVWAVLDCERHKQIAHGR
jgi:hypothetical protein